MPPLQSHRRHLHQRRKKKRSDKTGTNKACLLLFSSFSLVSTTVLCMPGKRERAGNETCVLSLPVWEGRGDHRMDMRRASRALVQRGTSLDILRTIRINKRRRLSCCTLSACKACADRRALTERIACGCVAPKNRGPSGALPCQNTENTASGNPRRRWPHASYQKQSSSIRPANGIDEHTL